MENTDAQILPGENMPNIIPTISPKSSHEWLVTHNANDFNVRKQVGGDILKNAQELNPDIGWGGILKAISWSPERGVKALTGDAAVNEAFSRGLSTTAKALGWSMDSPQVAYMSSAAVGSLVGRRLDYLRAEIAAIEEGRNKYPSEEVRQKRLAERTEEAGSLSAFMKRMKESREAYASEHIPEAADPTYLQVLQKLIYVGHGSRENAREKAYENLKKGNNAAALESLEAVPGGK